MSPSDREEPVVLPKNTTPTWEVELLLSGALVFATTQAPAAIDQMYFEWTPRAGGSSLVASSILFLYAKVVAYALILTFGLHLALRAIWVAMLGLYSVYPQGIDFDKLKRRPVFRDYLRSTIPAPGDAIERADNYASFVFALGILIATLSIAITVFSSVSMLVIDSVSHAITGVSAPPWVVLTIFSILLGPIMLVGLVDRYWGSRLAPNSQTARIMRAFYYANALISSGWITGYLMQTISSRLGTVKSNIVFIGVVYTLLAWVLVELSLHTGRLAMPGESLLPLDGRDRQLDSAHYRSRSADQAQLRPVPSIPDPLVLGPYLDLFIPHIESANSDDIARACPALAKPILDKDAPIASEQEARYTSELLDCAERVYKLTLNHEPISAGFDLGADQRGLRGYQVMIDVRKLPHGRHVISVARPQDPDEQRPVEPWRIVFWR